MGNEHCDVGYGEGCVGEAEAYRSSNRTGEGMVVLCKGHRDGRALLHNGEYVTLEYYDTIFGEHLRCENVLESGKCCGKAPANEYFHGDGKVTVLCIECFHQVPTASLNIREYYAMLQAA